MDLKAFMTESNWIEGIKRGPTDDEHLSAVAFLGLKELSLMALTTLQRSIAPGKPLRDKAGLNVRVGNHIAPKGGPKIIEDIESILLVAQIPDACPWMIHCVFEQIHPFMDGNGRTGRLLWAWMMFRNGQDALALPFLHRFYYQTLSSVRNVTAGQPEQADLQEGSAQ